MYILSNSESNTLGLVPVEDEGGALGNGDTYVFFFFMWVRDGPPTTLNLAASDGLMDRFSIFFFFSYLRVMLGNKAVR